MSGLNLQDVYGGFDASVSEPLWMNCLFGFGIERISFRFSYWHIIDPSARRGFLVVLKLRGQTQSFKIHTSFAKKLKQAGDV